MADQHETAKHTSARPIIDVAVGIVIRPSDGWILIGQRPPGKPFEGWWEFPGGKFDPGENAAQATARELDEELGIQVFESQPWVVREHVYEHAHVRLHFRRVTKWQGEPQSREGQAFAWCHPARVDVSPLLPASLAPIGWLGLPATYAISNAAELGSRQWLARLDAWLKAQQPGPHTAHASGVLPGYPGLVLLREPALDEAAFQALFRETLAALRGTDVRLLVSSRHPRACIEQAAEHAGGGVHLTATDLQMQATGQGRFPARAGQPSGASAPDAQVAPNPLRPDFPLVAASCHTPADLLRAGELGADFVVYGPVLPTRSHPDGSPLGWSEFARQISRTPVPVFGLGGLKSSDIGAACEAGAHGIAMQRAVWC
ncbi:MAG: thiamine phosphate synthase [Lautropia sp.]|nr:thiamine phosphate synthase [Lautropia sp.]